MGLTGVPPACILDQTHLYFLPSKVNCENIPLSFLSFLVWPPNSMLDFKDLAISFLPLIAETHIQGADLVWKFMFKFFSPAPP